MLDVIAGCCGVTPPLLLESTVPEYDLVNLSAQYRLNDTIGFGVDVSNVLDEEHYEAFGGDLLERRALGFVTLNW